jgi:hypothetical protein
MIDKTEVSGYTTLFIGVALLAFTFASAYIFLTSNPNIAGSGDLVAVFGVALAPLIETCIRIMYLGVMGWIGSLLTIRGVQLLTQLKREVPLEVKPITTENLKTKKTGKISKEKLVE